MESLLTYLVPISIGLVTIVLLLGLFNMAKGSSSSRSQMLMRWRVGLQFIAVVLIMAALYFSQ